MQLQAIMMKNELEHGESYSRSCCYFHPKEVVVGICPLCLRERLLSILASKQGHQYLPPATEISKRKSIFALVPRVFASSSNFVHHQGYSSDHSSEDQISIDEDFISIKIGEGGRATWNSKKSSTTGISKEAGQVLGMLTVERSSKSRVVRWRKRIIRLLFHVGLWREPGGVSSCHVEFGGKVEGGKERRGGWIRSLTRRRRRRRTTNGD